jgi:hypothetical protein
VHRLLVASFSNHEELEFRRSLCLLLLLLKKYLIIIANSRQSVNDGCFINESNWIKIKSTKLNNKSKLKHMNESVESAI